MDSVRRERIYPGETFIDRVKTPPIDVLPFEIKMNKNEDNINSRKRVNLDETFIDRVKTPTTYSPST